MDFGSQEDTMEPSHTDILISNMIGAVPEREAEIRTLWRTYNPAVVIKDGDRLTLDATTDRIEIDVKMIKVFWLVCFSGWHAIECYAPHVITSAVSGATIVDLLRCDDGLADVERDYKERIAAACAIIEGKDSVAALWPPDIPQPSADRDASDDPQYKAAFDLTGSAVAFTLFHEFYHVILDRDKVRPKDRREEELVCDVWAREFMTVKLEAYATAKGFDYHEVLRRRSMAFALAALILHEVTAVWERGGNCDYFSVATRMQTILDNTPLPDTDHFWNFAAALLIGICRQRHIPIDASAMSTRALTGHLLQVI
jgi:hypothetical protein